MDFKLTSTYQPTGDQPEAIRQLTKGVEEGEAASNIVGCDRIWKNFHHGKRYCPYKSANIGS